MNKYPGGISAIASTTAGKRIAEFIVSVAIATGLLLFGVFNEEMGEALFNACMLCLSCIGIGRPHFGLQDLGLLLLVLHKEP